MVNSCGGEKRWLAEEVLPVFGEVELREPGEVELLCVEGKDIRLSKAMTAAHL